MTPAPTRCPACGSGLGRHLPETDTDFEEWIFSCDAAISRAENGKLFVENDCEVITTKAVDALNKAAAPESPQGSETS